LHITDLSQGLWLNDLDSSTGEILFGGVNTEKYVGCLQTIPILEKAGKREEILVALTDISANGASIHSPATLPIAVLLDSGTTLTYLPEEMTRAIHDQVGVVLDKTTGLSTAYAPCALAQEAKTIDFTFSGVRISIPFNELVMPSLVPNSTNLQFHNGTAACMFGIVSNGGGASVLGDTFLRSAYVVYDLANNQVSLAQTVFNATTDNIKEIQVGVNGVPDAAMVPDPITSVVAGGMPGRQLGRLVEGSTSTIPVASEAASGTGTRWARRFVLLEMLLGMSLGS
jgi:hypothetical protein